MLAAALLWPVWTCGPAPANPLAGDWVVVGATPEAPCVFARGASAMFGDSVAGRAPWTAAGTDCGFGGSVPYRVTGDAAGGLRLAIGAWDSGPLAGRVLEGRVERHGPDRFRYEFDLGGADAMPGGNAPQTIRFVRKVN